MHRPWRVRSSRFGAANMVGLGGWVLMPVRTRVAPCTLTPPCGCDGGRNVRGSRQLYKTVPELAAGPSSGYVAFERWGRSLSRSAAGGALIGEQAKYVAEFGATGMEDPSIADEETA